MSDDGAREKRQIAPNELGFGSGRDRNWPNELGWRRRGTTTFSPTPGVRGVFLLLDQLGLAWTSLDQLGSRRGLAERRAESGKREEILS
jgi:hypothetical protein